MDYKQFLQECSKTELLSFFRRYESSMNRRKKYISPEDFYNVGKKEEQAKFDKAMKDVEKVVNESNEGGEKVDGSKKA